MYIVLFQIVGVFENPCDSGDGGGQEVLGLIFAEKDDGGPGDLEAEYKIINQWESDGVKYFQAEMAIDES